MELGKRRGRHPPSNRETRGLGAQLGICEFGRWSCDGGALVCWARPGGLAMPRPAQKNFGPVQLLGLGGGSRRNWGVSSAATKLFLAVPTVDVMCVLVDEIWLDGWFLFWAQQNEGKNKSRHRGRARVYSCVVRSECCWAYSCQSASVHSHQAGGPSFQHTLIEAPFV